MRGVGAVSKSPSMDGIISSASGIPVEGSGGCEQVHSHGRDNKHCQVGPAWRGVGAVSRSPAMDGIISTAKWDLCGGECGLCGECNDS